MADSIKIGSLDISAFKVGSSNCKIYLGDTLLYPQGEPPTPPVFDEKYKLTLSDSSTVSAECSSSSSITQAEISAYTSTLTSAVIGQCVTDIVNNAFRNCTSLTSVTISDSVATIYNSAFRNCTSLTSVTCFATTPPTLSSIAFQYTSLQHIYVPSASVETYKSAVIWSNYASIIQAIPNS